MASTAISRYDEDAFHTLIFQYECKTPSISYSIVTKKKTYLNIKKIEMIYLYINTVLYKIPHKTYKHRKVFYIIFYVYVQEEFLIFLNANIVYLIFFLFYKRRMTTT